MQTLIPTPEDERLGQDDALEGDAQQVGDLEVRSSERSRQGRDLSAARSRPRQFNSWTVMRQSEIRTKGLVARTSLIAPE